MRESIGATYIFSICLTFIILFTAYLAISLNYAKAFRIKSNIVSMIEENEGYCSNNLEQKVRDYLISEGYTASGTCSPNISSTNSRTVDDYRLVSDGCIDIYNTGKCNACIYRRERYNNSDDIGDSNSYYKVVAFFKFDLPILNVLTNFKVGGETKMIHEFGSCN